MRKRPLIYLACVFLAGLAYQRFSMKWLMVICIAFILMEMRIGSKTKRLKKAAGRSIILLSAFLIGVFHMKQEENFRAAYMSKMIDGSRVTVWGECVQVETTEYGNRGFLSDCYIRIDEKAVPCNDIVVYTSKDQLQIGQIHKIDGKINMFSRARNEGNFDSYRYYQSLKTDFAVDAEVVSVFGEPNWKKPLWMFREKAGVVYDSALTEKAAGFYRAMVLGDKTDLDQDLKDLFLIGGISHILAISGLHVSILGRGFYRMLRKRGIGFCVAGAVAGGLLLLYSVIVGSSASTVRAVGMMLLFFFSQWIGRSYDMLNGLGSLILYLLENNPFLIENSGFWFSVMALLGVGVVGDELAKGKEKTKGIWMSLGISLATIPVTALSYFEVPMYSPLVNYIILPLLTPAFLLAVVVGMLGATIPILAGINILLKPCEWLVNFYEWICQLVSKLPGANLICGKPENWRVVLYYVFLFLGIYLLAVFRTQKKQKERRCTMVVLILLCGLCIFFPKSKPFEITFLDVGQGDGVYISAGDGTSFFVDGGSSNVEGVGEYRILPFLKSKGIRQIDYWFVSHMDTDHVSGLWEVLEDGYKINYIVVNEQCSNEEDYIRLQQLTEERGTKLLYVKSGDRLCSRDLEISCLAPLAKEEVTDKNDNSLVLHVKHKGSSNKECFEALLAGDISSEREKQLCEAGVFKDVDLFKANHHGSNYSNSAELFSIIQPEYIVISCSKSNRYGHPGEAAIERMKESGANVFYTMEDGQITFPLIQ